MESVTPIEVRAARPGDTAQWAAMRERLWPAEPGEHAREIEAYFAGERTEPFEVFLAWDGDEAIGFAEASIRPYAEGCYSGRVAYLEGLYVVPEQRRRGVARALVGAVEAWGRAQGCTELGSDTELDNDVSAAMHRALGFDEVERIICFRKDL